MFPANNLEKYFNELNEQNWTLIPIDPAFASKLQNSAESKLNDNKFKTGNISQSELPDTTIRSDSTFWLDAKSDSLNNTDNSVLFNLDLLSAALKSYFRISLTKIECHYAAYQPGNFYKKHCDCTQQNNQRIFSFIIYLNSFWKDQDGGQLIAYENEKVLFKINPEIGQMILFKSEIEHEVLVTERTRLSLAGWVRK